MLRINFADTNLNEILQTVFNGSHYIWSILFIDVVFKPNTKYNLDEIITQSLQKKGYKISWEMLLDIAKDIYDVHDILIVGVFDESNIPSRNSEINNIGEKVEVMIEGFDSSYWNINQKISL